MSLLSAKLLDSKTIKLKVSNNFYGGITNLVYLRSENIMTELTINKKKKRKDYTEYFIELNTEICLSKEYEIVIDRSMRTTLNIEDIVFNDTFDNTYYYDGPLGSFYTKEKTTFYVWAPTATTVKLDVIKSDGTSIMKTMERIDKGVWTTVIFDDLESASYVYLPKISGTYNEAFDPYAYSSTPNSKRSVIIDLEKVNDKVDKKNLPTYESFTDYIIYETSVRDFTISAHNINNKAKFKGLTESNVLSKEGNTVGLDYIEELGITHLQLMPFYDFGSILEEEPTLFYNWGYDPVNYNVPEGGYITDVFDPYKRILELKEMIQSINNKGIYVNMDVVYNHMFDVYTSCFHNLVPNYYFRYDKNKKPSNGSFCGNDTESLHLMMRRFIVDSVLRWVTMYGVDGFRFDLMGIHDVDTMNIIRKKLDEINPMIIVYGEGWHMPSTLKDSLKASIVNQKKVPNIAMFNDRFRDTLKGPHSNPKERGFLCGDKTKSDMAASCYTGTVLGYKDVKSYMLKPTTTINYASCHDNYTIFDQYMIKYKVPSKVRELQSFNLANLFLTQGIIFFHSGSEFFRTKLGEENSYNTSDDANQIDWDLRDTYANHIDFIKEIIKIRKSFKGYRLSTKQLIKKHVLVTVLKQGIIEYIINYNNETYSHYINATNKPFTKKLKQKSKLLINKYEASVSGLIDVKEITVEPFSLVALKSIK